MSADGMPRRPSLENFMRTRHLTALASATVLLLAACGSDDPTSASTPETEAGTAVAATNAATDIAVIAGEPFPDARCAANEAAGTITYLTGFDFAAAASIVEIIAAEAAGYYTDLCLDVDIKASFSVANYPLIADNTAQFASGGSFSEVAAFAMANDADFVVTAVEGRTAIETLIVKAGQAAELGDLAGSTIGVKGKLPPSIEAMMLTAGLTEGDDFKTVLLDGFDPTQHIAIPTIVGFPGFKSNEPGGLNRAGIGFQTFDPLDFNIPGSFGAIYTNQIFIAEHPTAAEDFMRATMRGLADSLADPVATANIAVEKVNANGNPNFLSPEGEVFRWETDAELIIDTTPEGVAFGVPDATMLQAELDAYGAVGLFGDNQTPDAASRLGNDIIASVYDVNGMVIWPG
ncbi:MAG: ABC-type nitrate/sulfonate/bicarbonate transport system substrate-binding protein [Ilumatobacter sp.]|jgi:NitT/TauT family transport system substrate-binding protein